MKSNNKEIIIIGANNYYPNEGTNDPNMGSNLSDKTEKVAKTIFCPVCTRTVSLEYTVGGLCRDCFNND